MKSYQIAADAFQEAALIKKQGPAPPNMWQITEHK